METNLRQSLPCHFCGQLTLSPDAFCCPACGVLSKMGLKQTIEHSDNPRSLAVQELYNFSESQNEKRYRLSLQGLQCSSCVHLLEKLPQYLPDVLEARVNYAKSEMLVVTTNGISLKALTQFIEEMGYPCHPLQNSETSAASEIAANRDSVRRLGVAGACAGNIMLFTVPLYGGLSGSLAQLFKGVSFFLFLPILFYAAVPLYRNAWRGIRFGVLPVDAPLVVAMWAGFLASLFNFLRGDENLYLDSTAGFIFLILISRWFLRVTQKRWIEAPLSQSPWRSQVVNLHQLNAVLEIPAAQLKVGDSYSLKAGQIVPVDSILKASRASFDTTWMTGESVPRVLQIEMPIDAGFRSLEECAQFQAVSDVDSSQLALGLQRIESQSLSSSHKINLFDRAARHLLTFVFIVGAMLIAMGPWLGLELAETFQRALSLLIVACPCALAFGGPLAYGMALRRAAEGGVLLKSADVLDKVAECKTIIFDKTGTLTEGRLKLVSQSPADLPEWMKHLILTLESHSRHPVADAFRAAWLSPGFQPLIVNDIHETPGERIVGLYGIRMYCLESKRDPTSKGIEVAFLQDGSELARFVFEDRLRSESLEILHSLANSYQLEILSGDREDRVQNLITSLNIPSLKGRGNCLPAGKAIAVKTKNPCLMVGDGLNDLEALASAHVGIALNGAIEHGLLKGSGYFLQSGLKPLLALLESSVKARRLMHRNLAFALAYNLLAGAAALLGMINPLVAALLMPLSSGLIILSTWIFS